jgi:PAS domain S-box-containing protein
MLDSVWQLAKLRGWSYDVASGLLKGAPGTKEIFQLPADELQQLTLSKFLQLVHPADRHQVEKLSEDVLRGDLPAVSYHYRVPGPDGRDRFIVGHAQCEFKEDGKLQMVYGTIMDVTEQVRRQRQVEFATTHLHG